MSAELAAEAVDDRIRCDACPVMCFIRPGQAGACDRYANRDGELIRVDPHVVLERAVEAGGTLVPVLGRRGGLGRRAGRASPRPSSPRSGPARPIPDYKPAPFIVAVRGRGRRHGHGRDRGHLLAIAASR